MAEGADEQAFAFLAGEATRLIPLRRLLRELLPDGREQVSASGYWRRGVAGLDHHAPLDPDAGE
jgi:NADPH-dependent ferric siderophore reductase